jgi:hypothetical protein
VSGDLRAELAEQRPEIAEVVVLVDIPQAEAAQHGQQRPRAAAVQKRPAQLADRVVEAPARWVRRRRRGLQVERSEDATLCDPLPEPLAEPRRRPETRIDLDEDEPPVVRRHAELAVREPFVAGGIAEPLQRGHRFCAQPLLRRERLERDAQPARQRDVPQHGVGKSYL